MSPSQNQDGVQGKTRPAVSPYQNTDGVSGNTSSGLGSSLHSSPLRRSSPRYPVPRFFKTNLIKCKTCKSLFLMISVHRNSSPTHAGGNLTAQAHKMDLSGGTGPGTGEGKEGGVAGSGGICNLSAILSDLSYGDRRAPGCEKKVHKLDVILHSTEKTQTQVAQIATAADYEQKRMMATKAMHHKVINNLFPTVLVN